MSELEFRPTGYLVLRAPLYVHAIVHVPAVDWRVNWWTARHSLGGGDYSQVDAWEDEGGAIQWDVNADTVD